MVKYWKTQDSVEAKVMLTPEGHYVIQMQGEKYPFPGYPRGGLLYGSLSPLKHQIKNQIFNEAWALLETGASQQDVLNHIKHTLIHEIYPLAEKSKMDMVPFERLNPPIKELHRAMTVVAKGSQKWETLRDIICFILQEDDGYRNRFQWMVKFFPRWFKPKVEHFDRALSMFQHGEEVGDMKERMNLFRRIFMFALNDPDARSHFEAFLKEVDWQKVKLTKADLYFFRAKYFRPDWPEYQY